MKTINFIFIISFFSFFIFIQCQINSEKKISDQYQRLASLYCYIDNYPEWLEQQTNLKYFLQFSHFFNIDTEKIQNLLEKYRLQHQCLRAFERLPILIGSG